MHIHTYISVPYAVHIFRQLFSDLLAVIAIMPRRTRVQMQTYPFKQRELANGDLSMTHSSNICAESKYIVKYTYVYNIVNIV